MLKEKNRFFVFLFFIYPWAIGIKPLLAETAVSSTSILQKAMEFDSKIEQATFHFDEKFTLEITSETVSIQGRVYLDRKNSRARIDYSGAVKARIWIEGTNVYFCDDSLKQVIVREMADFEKRHLQAFMDIPLLQGTENFGKRFKFTLDKPKDSLVSLKAVPTSQAPYHLILRFHRETGQPVELDLVMENYRAELKISKFDAKSKIREKVFERKFPPDYAIMDLRKSDVQ